jgi:hypothetical protein
VLENGVGVRPARFAPGASGLSEELLRVPRRRLLQPGDEAEVVHGHEEEVRDRRVVHAVRGIQKQLVQCRLGAVQVIFKTVNKKKNTASSV